MLPIDLANIKTRLIGCSAVMGVGQIISNLLSSDAVKVLGMPGDPVVWAVSAGLGAIAASLAGNLMANELGNEIVDRLSKNPKILNNHDLTKAAGEAIGYILKEVAGSDRLIAIAEAKNLPYPAEPLSQLADKSVEYWLKINTNTADLSSGLKISEDQLNKIFSGDAEEFDRVTGLTPEDWGIFLSELAASEGKSFDVDIVEFVANRLYESFPKAFREVLKDDAKTGGQKFAAMVLNLHQITLGELKSLGLQTGEVLQKLEAIATQQQVCELVKKLDAIALDIRDDLAQVKASLQRLVDTSATRLPLPYECETIIQDRTQDFTGRKFVFDAITQFLQQNPKGYFVLQAEPGVGKSSIMAKLVLLLKRRCVAHFNSQSQGTVKAEQFLESVCSQLIQRFQLNYPQLPENATRDGNFLSWLLGKFSAKLNGKKLIFVVDALDEVDLSFQVHNSNVLYLPDALPDNVYFIVSKRPEFLPLPVNHRVFDLMKYDAESLADVKTYLEKRTDKSASIQSWINHQNLQREEFVTAVAEKSEKKFIYLRYVLDEIESGDYKDVNLNDLPAGLQAYYQKHWGQIMGRENDLLLELKVNIIYKLSQVREPVSCRWLAKSVRETTFKVQQVLRKWDSFLRQQQVNSEIRYSIYHNSFRQFLEADETVQAAGITLEEINRKIMDNLTEGGTEMSDLGVWLAKQWAEDREYLLKYAPSKFVKGRNFQCYYNWLIDFDFIKGKLELLGVQPLIEDYDLARNSDVLLSEVQRSTLKLIQGAIRKSTHVLEKDKTQLAGHLLGRLLPQEVTKIVDKSKYLWEYLPLISRFLPRKTVKKVIEKISVSDEIQAMLEQVKQSKDFPWLRPLKANLELANEGALWTLAGHIGLVYAVAIAPDGKTAISASEDKTLKIWDTETGRELKTLTGHTHGLTAVAIAPDGKTAISASGDKTLKIWDTETGRELKTLTGHTNLVTAVAIAPDGKTAISASGDKTLKIWDTETGRELKTLTGHTNLVTAVAIAPDGKTAISASGDKTLKIWDTETGRELKTLTGHTDLVRGVAIAPDGKTAISASGDKTLKIWDTETGRELKTLTGHTDLVRGVAIAPDGKTAISASGDKTLKIWDTETGRELKTLTGHTNLVTAVAIAPDGKTAISASGDKTLKIWDTETGRELKTLTGHTNLVTAVAIAPDGKTAISASGDKTLKIWDTETGRELKTLTGHTDLVRGVAIAPDGKTAISASGDKTLKIWDTETDRELKTLTSYTNWLNAVALAPDGKTAISGSSNNLNIWDTETGRELKTLTGHTNHVRAVAIAPDGKTAISASSDRTLKIWDTETGRELKTLTGHTDYVIAVAIAPDGKTAISASWDNSLKIWDTDTGRELKTLTGHTGGVTAVAIAPDGKTAISASGDKTLKIWDLLSGEEVAGFSGDVEFECCAILPDGMTVLAGDRSGRVHFLRLEGMGDLCAEARNRLSSWISRWKAWIFQRNPISLCRTEITSTLVNIKGVNCGKSH